MARAVTVPSEYSNSGDHYDVIWCIQSLYIIPSARVADLIAILKRHLAFNGQCLIYLPCKESAYMTLYDLYRCQYDSNQQLAPYLTAEDVLQAAGHAHHIQCNFNHRIAYNDHATLENYLNIPSGSINPSTMA